MRQVLPVISSVKTRDGCRVNQRVTKTTTTTTTTQHSEHVILYLRTEIILVMCVCILNMFPINIFQNSSPVVFYVL